MATSSKIHITIDRNELPAVRVVTENASNSVGHTLSMAGLSGLFKEIVDGVGMDVTMPWVDLLSTDHQFAIQQRFGGKHTIVWTRPSMPRKIKVYSGLRDEREERTITFPAITWVIQWNMGNVVTAQLFTSARCPVSIEDRETLYAFPYGNVYDRGEICWGDSNVDAGITSRCPTPGAVDRFFFHGAAFNHDLVFAESLSGDDRDDPDESSGLAQVADGAVLALESGRTGRKTLPQIIGDLK